MSVTASHFNPPARTVTVTVTAEHVSHVETLTAPEARCLYNELAEALDSIDRPYTGTDLFTPSEYDQFDPLGRDIANAPAVVVVGLDGRSQPMYRYATDLQLPDHARRNVAPEHRPARWL